MSEQLWYTWSAFGFGMTTGFRVRAASRGFMDINGSVNMDSERFLTLMKHLNYNLPHDASDPYTVNSQQAPRSLAFVQAGQERILINKAYTGLDGIRRPGAFFSHLLTDLPSSPCPDGQLPFSAREAIELWGSNFWEESEIGIDPKQVGLPSPDKIPPGPLSARDVASATELLYVIQAFLTLPTLGEQKRLYIAGPPETVATLIWGLTNALPRTLHVMRTLTFSTYESDLEEKILSMLGQQATEKIPLVIVGTCWLCPSAQDLPSMYYQEQNPYGLAINCYLPDRKTPLTPDPLVNKFAQFAIQCFTNGNMNNLTALLNEAEKQNITEVPKFLELYTSFQDNLSKDDIRRILTKLYIKMKTLLKNFVNALNEGKILSADEFRQWKSIQSEAAMLKRSNVQKSIICLLTNERSWWQEEGWNMIQQLCQLIGRYSEDQIDIGRVTFIKTFSANLSGPRSLFREVKNKFANSSVENDSLTEATIFAEEATNAIRMAQNELADALISLVTDFAYQIIQAISANDSLLTTSWNNILTDPIFDCIKVKVWAYMIKQLSMIHYTSVYQQWWNGYGKTNIQQMSNLLDAQPGSELDQACLSFIKKAAQELLEAIKNDQIAVLSFWQDLLYTTAPYTQQRNSNIWLDLLVYLYPFMHVSAYQQWWQAQGRAAARSLRSFADKSPQSEIASTLSDCAYNTSVNLSILIDESISKIPKDNDIQLLIEILDIVTPVGSTDVWLGLVMDLCEIVHAPAYRRWWQLQGKRVILSLRQIADKSPLSEIASKLSDCAQCAINELHIRLVNNASEAYQVNNIQILLELIDTMMPTGNTTLWPNLLQKLSTVVHQQVDEAFSWELRALLLQTWGSIPILENNEYILRDWLTVGWQELDKLLALKLPARWQKAGIMNVLIATPDYSQVDVMSIVKEHQRLFKDVLEHLMKTPAHQQHAVRLFASLAQYNYHNLTLLDKMLAACQYHKDVVEKLLASLQLESQLGSKYVVDLLENHCQVLLSEHELTPTLVGLIQHYLNNFDPNYLNTDPTRELLQRLLNRHKDRTLKLPSELHKPVKDWYRIAEFMKDSDGARKQLWDLSDGTLCITQLTPDTRSKLADNLVPYLVTSVSNEMELVRVIENLGKVLVGQARGGIVLLERMAKIAGENYGQERPLVRIGPYINVVLHKSRCFLLAEKEEFIDCCFSSLLKLVDTKTRDTFNPNHDLIAEWQAYLSRSSCAAIIEALHHFKRALNKREMEAIINAYDPSLENHLEPQELELLNLAHKFVTAYQTDDDAALLDADRTINESPYHQMLGYTQTQTERLSQARNRMSAASQPTPGVVSQRYPQTPSSVPAQQPGSGNNEPIANVKGQTITLEQLEWAFQLKDLYTKYRISDLRRQIRSLKEDNHTDKKGKRAELKLIEDDLSELQKISGDPERLRKATLDDLVNDVLIREEIDKLIRQNQINKDQLGTEADTILKFLIDSYGYQCPSQDANATEKTLNILRIFRQHEWFADYLYRSQNILLKEWLKKQRQLEGTQIHINYDLAEIKAPNKPFGWLDTRRIGSNIFSRTFGL